MECSLKSSNGVLLKKDKFSAHFHVFEYSSFYEYYYDYNELGVLVGKAAKCSNSKMCKS